VKGGKCEEKRERGEGNVKRRRPFGFSSRSRFRAASQTPERSTSKRRVTPPAALIHTVSKVNKNCGVAVRRLSVCFVVLPMIHSLTTSFLFCFLILLLQPSSIEAQTGSSTLFSLLF
jgi:hypothetical protein